MIFIFIVKKTKIKLLPIFSFIILTLTVLNFTVLKRDYLLQRQNAELNMVEADNLHYHLYSYIANSQNDSQIITNYSPICKLIPPEGIQFKYLSINAKLLLFMKQETSKVLYLLVEKDKLNNNIAQYIDKAIKDKDYLQSFDDGRFILLKVASRNI